MATAAKARLVRATTELMRRHGVAGTAVSEILSDSGAARRSIYLNFPGGKSQLVTEATRVAGASMAVAIREILDADDPIEAFTTLWIALLSTTDFDAGCPIVAAALGRADAAEAADLAGEIFTEWYGLVGEHLMAEGIAPDMAESLSITVVSAVEGAVVACQALRSTRPLEEVGVRLRELMAIHRPMEN
ncbi:TetR/AcrR family transcriptional regulator [Gordonia sp. HY285]|uniref:TetR/AcrR family transcriptional regulator n=1 Tax=Gordonia liuliyuniae TaxID=2911517 RepID=UPI001F2F309B|nr:TetR family transcriptional regulator [Gordonia liuliyuniae]MCF8610515.1 TetR/AcrR family transcriptional regulator [Gordonia liuliyuniae]